MTKPLTDLVAIAESVKNSGYKQWPNVKGHIVHVREVLEKKK